MRWAQTGSFVHEALESSIHDHLLSDERRAVQATTRAFAHDEVMPIANELDPRRAEFPPELLIDAATARVFQVTLDRQAQIDAKDAR